MKRDYLCKLTVFSGALAAPFFWETILQAPISAGYWTRSISAGLDDRWINGTWNGPVSEKNLRFLLVPSWKTQRQLDFGKFCLLDGQWFVRKFNRGTLAPWDPLPLAPKMCRREPFAGPFLPHAHRVFPSCVQGAPRKSQRGVSSEFQPSWVPNFNRRNHKMPGFWLTKWPWVALRWDLNKLLEDSPRKSSESWFVGGLAQLLRDGWDLVL